MEVVMNELDIAAILTVVGLAIAIVFSIVMLAVSQFAYRAANSQINEYVKELYDSVVAGDDGDDPDRK